MSAKRPKATFSITDYKFDESSVKAITEDKFINLWPLIYIISNDKIGEAYIGESTNAYKRMRNHLSNQDRLRLNTLHLITSDEFNKSAALDIEFNLIKYIAADKKYKLQNVSPGLVYHTYYEQEKYLEMFQKIWLELKKRKLAQYDLKQINNTDLFIYSPYKSLSIDQYEVTLSLIKLLIENDKNSIFIEGSAGTGKTILAIYLIKLLVSAYQNLEDEEDIEDKEELDLLNSFKKKYKTLEIGLVVPMTSLRSTLKKVFRNIKGLRANMVIGPSEVLNKKYDILIVDEAHRLRRRVGITNYRSFDENNETLKLGEAGDELDWVLKQSKHQIFFYDMAQSIKPSDIRKEKFISLKSKKESSVLKLKSQHRVKGGIDYIEYVDKLLTCKLKKNESIFKSKDYEFVLFDSMKQLIDAINIKEDEFGLCRLVAGYSWVWKSKNQKSATDIKIEGINLKWNSTNADWINSKTAKHEVGCIHTTQGYDLNYVGIIFGNEISYNPITNEIIIKKENYHDRNGKVGIKTKDAEELKTYIINIYKTLMFRGVKGTYIYVCDKNLREYFKEHIKIN